jgi:flavodoxin
MIVDQPNQPKLLVVFFSRTGTTRCLAEHIARATGADLEELKENQSRRGLWGWLRSGYEGTYRRSAKPLPVQRHLRDYDLVFVGSPTWNRALASPVRGFLEQHASELTNVALFATCQGQGATEVNAQMAALLKNAPLATLTMLERDVKRSPAVEVGELTEAALCAWESGRAKR